MNTPNKRDRLVNAAATLFHRKGVMATSLADIAKDADIPIGNVYYYFKTKEELALSALALHKEHYIARFNALEEESDDPRQRLRQSLDYYETMIDEFTRYGCPIGKIVMDSGSDNGTITKAAAEVFHCCLHWAEQQFEELGHADNAKTYAASMLAGIEGAALLAKAMNDPEMMKQELARLAHFIDTLPNKRIQLGKVAMKMSAA